MLQTLAIWFFSVAVGCNDFYNNLTYKIYLNVQNISQKNE